MIRLAVRVARADAELALAELLTLAPHGMEEIELADGRIEFAIYGAEGEIPALPDLEAAVGGVLVEVLTSEVADDWPERWRDFHVAQVVGARLRIRPPWLVDPDDGLLDVVIEPAQAFGTGAHPTTRLCLELLLGLPAPGGALLDLGCGSGVLAIAAAKLGFDPVIALDHELESVRATRENAAANGVAVAARRGDLRRDDLPQAPTVAANLLLPLLLELAERLDRAPSRLIASGLLRAQADQVAAAFGERHRMHELERRHEGDWSALLLAG
ncbi:MAG: hypothetical protein NVSMB51_19400 [Solirubrobacteraceae bacterium]